MLNYRSDIWMVDVSKTCEIDSVIDLLWSLFSQHLAQPYRRLYTTTRNLHRFFSEWWASILH